ncbi:MAG TPA: thiol-disulfide oxidoreductase DCC family protein [Candidatus Kapabacteria bacterium]|nr:thiol-disulfide oxidoreductase DCC family protein [Candidatus Kapabacteria bacterium]
MPAVVIFDGICNFCNSSVNFVIDHDPDQRYKFAASQSESGQKLLTEYNIAALASDTFILIEEGNAFTRSTAALRIAKHLRGPWKLCYGFIVIPRPIRDVVYQFISRNRYKWFGRKETCRIPTAEERARFL